MDAGTMQAETGAGQAEADLLKKVRRAATNPTRVYAARDFRAKAYPVLVVGTETHGMWFGPWGAPWLLRSEPTDSLVERAIEKYGTGGEGLALAAVVDRYVECSGSPVTPTGLRTETRGDGDVPVYEVGGGVLYPATPIVCAERNHQHITWETLDNLPVLRATEGQEAVALVRALETPDNGRPRT